MNREEFDAWKSKYTENKQPWARMAELIDVFVVAEDRPVYATDSGWMVLCNDLFSWGCGDAEPLTEDNVLDLSNALEDCEKLGHRDAGYDLFVCRIRGERPQGAAYPKAPELWPLFDACGPERKTGLGNPRKHPGAP